MKATFPLPRHPTTYPELRSEEMHGFGKASILDRFINDGSCGHIAGLCLAFDVFGPSAFRSPTRKEKRREFRMPRSKGSKIDRMDCCRSITRRRTGGKMHIDVLQECELLNRFPFVFGKRTLEQGRPSVISCTFGDPPHFC